MKRKLFLLFFGLLSLCGFSALAQSYYEFTYKNQAGKQCYGFMIYEDDTNCTMRVIEVAKNQDVTAVEDIKYKGEQGSEEGQQYTALCPEKQQANAPIIVFFWNKLKGSKDVELIPGICFDLEKLDFKDPDSFAEVGLADISDEYLQQFYAPDEEAYKKILGAKKEVVLQRERIAKNLGDGEDIYRIVMELLAENGCGQAQNSQSACTPQQNTSSQCNSDVDADDCGSDDLGCDDPDDDGDYDGEDNSGNGNGGNYEPEQEDEPAPNYNNPSPSQNATPSTSPNNSGGVTLHFVSVINSKVNDIGASCERDYDNFLSELKGIAQALGMQFKNHNVMGNYYSRDAVVETLNGLRPSSNDVVLFYYSGHGFRFDDQQSQYPAIDLTTSSYDDVGAGNYLLMSDIYEEICSKKARLNIVLSDCCNTKIGIPTPSMRESGTLYSRANNNFSLSRLGQLFLQGRGNLLSTAASPGETSICDMMGGFFTVAFIRSLRKEISATNSQDVSWNTVIDNTISSAKQRSSEVGNLQHGIKETTMY